MPWGEYPSPQARGPVLVRALRVEDAGPYAQAFVEDPDLGRLLGIEQDPDEPAVRGRITRATNASSEPRSMEFAIADQNTDVFLGSVVLHSYSAGHRRAEVGFWVVPQARHAGVALAGVSALIDWAFQELGLRRIEMTTTPENPAVPAFAGRLGFAHEGTLRGRNIEQGRVVDILWFGLLESEWSPS